MSRYVPSSPHFFRPVGRALALGVLALAVLAWLVPAPLEPPADPSQAPNPAKSAWFLLWIQELVSWTTSAIYLAIALAALLVALPWLPLKPLEQASWFPRPYLPVVAAVFLVSAGLLALTVVGLFLRGPEWRLVWPF